MTSVSNRGGRGGRKSAAASPRPNTPRSQRSASNQSAAAAPAAASQPAALPANSWSSIAAAAAANSQNHSRQASPAPGQRHSAHGSTTPQAAPSQPTPTPKSQPVADTASQPSTNSVSAPNSSVTPALQFLLEALNGTHVVAHTASGRYVGVLDQTSPSGGLGATLLLAYKLPDSGDKEQGPTGPIEKLIIAPSDLKEIRADDVHLAKETASSKSSATGRQGGFQTDTQISARDGLGSARNLQRWDASEWGGNSSSTRNDLTFGNTKVGAWDQFATNEAKFGVKTNYHEDLYTTKLDRSGADFGAREKEAERLAQEIMSEMTNDKHRAEERGIELDDNENEEDKYGAVLREQKEASTAAPKAKEGVYTPPNMRQAPATGSTGTSTSTVPATSSTNSDKAKTLAAVSQSALARSQVEKDEAATARTSGSGDGKREAPLAAYEESFVDFVTSEQSKIIKIERDKSRIQRDRELSSLREWANNFKVKGAMPEDISVWGSKKEKSSESERTNVAAQAKAADTSTGTTPGSAPVAATSGTTSDSKGNVPIDVSKLAISKVPPFNPLKAGTGDKDTTKLSAKATEFKPLNSSAAVFTPGKPFVPSASLSTNPPASLPKPATVANAPATPASSPSPSKPINPFFGTKVPVALDSHDVLLQLQCLPRNEQQPRNVSPHWPYKGRSFRTIFAPPSAIPPAGSVVPASPAPSNMPGLTSAQGTPMPGPVPFVSAPNAHGDQPTKPGSFSFASPPIGGPGGISSPRPAQATRGAKSPGVSNVLASGPAAVPHGNAGVPPPMMHMQMPFAAPMMGNAPGPHPGASPGAGTAQAVGPGQQPYVYLSPGYAWPQGQGMYGFPPGAAPQGLAPMHLPGPQGFVPGMPPPGFAPAPGFHPHFSPMPVMGGPHPGLPPHPGGPMTAPQHHSHHHHQQQSRQSFKAYHGPRRSTNNHASPGPVPALATASGPSPVPPPAQASSGAPPSEQKSEDRSGSAPAPAGKAESQ